MGQDRKKCMEMYKGAWDRIGRNAWRCTKVHGTGQGKQDLQSEGRPKLLIVLLEVARVDRL